MRPSPARPIGTVTRGTTHPNRLRRVDRWIASVLGANLRQSASPVVLDLGFGASAVTTVELARRLAPISPAIEVIGLEIDQARVRAARAAYPSQRFEVGGFELGGHAGRAALVRAFNVLRQYDEADVPEAWHRMTTGCAPGGVVVEGTCDELGRVACWVRLDRDVSRVTPVSLTVSLRLAGLERPSDAAARLPKALIHHNVPGEGVHALLRALDAAWAAAAPWADLGARQRWLRTVAAVRSDGFGVLGGPARWRLGEITVAWADVAP